MTEFTIDSRPTWLARLARLLRWLHLTKHPLIGLVVSVNDTQLGVITKVRADTITYALWEDSKRASQ